MHSSLFDVSVVYANIVVRTYVNITMKREKGKRRAYDGRIQYESKKERKDAEERGKSPDSRIVLLRSQTRTEALHTHTHTHSWFNRKESDRTAACGTEGGEGTDDARAIAPARSLGGAYLLSRTDAGKDSRK